MVRFFTLGLWAASIATAFGAAETSCGGGQKCPGDLPCCSQYGKCGVGAYCLGGCDPLNSKSLDSCVPGPVCKSQDYKFSSLDGITPKTKYLGDASKTDWVSDGTPTPYQDAVLLTMAQGTVGTLLASSTYMWYGKVSSTLKTSRGKGVVTAFILLSDVKDEIDFEFVGADLSHAQTNYYFQGITNYVNGQNISLANTFDNYHTYTIDWQPDSITWSIDGQVGRILKKSDTYNKTTNQYHYPQSPSRVQLSLWPAGLASNGKGTIDWSGGLIDWNSKDIQNNKYYYAAVKDVSVQCYDPPADTKASGKTSYVYTKDSGTQDVIEITDKPTTLKSLLGTGTNMSAGDPALDPPASKGSPPAPINEPASVPGLSGAGTGGTSSSHGTDTKAAADNVNSAGSGSSGGSVSGSGSGSGGGSGTAQSSSSTSLAPPKATSTGFSQGTTMAGTKSGGVSLLRGGPSGEKVLRGSISAGLLAVAGVMLM